MPVAIISLQNPLYRLGCYPTQLMRVDNILGNVCLTDPTGASVPFFDTRVRLEKV